MCHLILAMLPHRQSMRSLLTRRPRRCANLLLEIMRHRHMTTMKEVALRVVKHWFARRV